MIGTVVTTERTKEGFHSDENGPFEVFFSRGGCPDAQVEPGEPAPPGWYWWPCSPGCLPDGEAEGPYDTSREAYNAASPSGGHLV